MKVKIRLTGIVFILILLSCERDVVDRIPDVYFSIELDIQNDPQFFYLRAQDNAMVVSARQMGVSNLGYNNNGLIIYNAGGGTFYAFDRTCPHEIPDIVQINLTDNNIASCPDCESRYILPSEGVPSTGSVSKYFLKKYKSQYNSQTGILYVYN